MNSKTIALTTSALVAVAALATTASAGGMMGDVRLGLGYNWVSESAGGGGLSDLFSGDLDGNYTSFSGGARVNLPYSDTVNIQLDLNADSSLEQSAFNRDNENVSDVSATSFGGHINYRDQEGLLGVFAGSGRVHDVIGSPIFMAGFEGQYYLPEWTLSAQVGYLDSDLSLLLQNAGFVRAGVTYYPSSKLKLTGSLAYIDGENNLTTDPNINIEEWAWSVGVHYWFGKSIPVSGFFEYKGRSEEASSGNSTGDVDHDVVQAGVTFHFGGDGFKDADRTGPSVDLPDTDWFKLVPTVDTGFLR